MSTVSFGAAGAGKARASRWQGTVLVAALGLLLAALGGAFLLTIPWSEARAHLTARSWPVAQARVLSVSLAEERRSGRRGVETELVLTVAYEFEVEGLTVAGHRAGLTDRAEPHDRDLKTLYRKLNFARLTGRTVPVFHHPHDPALAYLDIGFAWKPAALRAGLGSAAILLGLLLVGGGIRRQEKTSLL